MDTPTEASNLQRAIQTWRRYPVDPEAFKLVVRLLQHHQASLAPELKRIIDESGDTSLTMRSWLAANTTLLGARTPWACVWCGRDDATIYCGDPDLPGRMGHFSFRRYLNFGDDYVDYYDADDSDYYNYNYNADADFYTSTVPAGTCGSESCTTRHVRVGGTCIYLTDSDTYDGAQCEVHKESVDACLCNEPDTEPDPCDRCEVDPCVCKKIR